MKCLLPVALLALVASGCCRLPAFSDGRTPRTIPHDLRQDFAPEQAVNLDHKLLKTTENHYYTLTQVQLEASPSPYATNRTLIFDCFVPPGTNPCPVLLVLPILGGKKYPLESYFARYFAKKGLASIIVHRQEKGDPKEAAQIEGWLRQTILDNRQALDWIETQERFDADRIGLFGISMGGIKGAMLAPLDDRIKAAVIGLAGEDLPYILSQTTEPGIRRRRARFLEEQNMSLEQFRQELQNGLTCDPALFAPYVDPDKTLLVLALTDTVVPINRGLQMRRHMGRPATVFVPAGHYSAILFIHYIRWHCARFLKKQLFPLTNNAQ